MALVTFPSRENAEVVEVEFVSNKNDIRPLNLLVDSGFTGESSFVLGHEPGILRAAMPDADVVGALRGTQKRALVTCRIGALGFQKTLIAIIADITQLSLPAGVRGIAGLTFLRQFGSWGAQRTGHGWQFWLSVPGNESASI